MKWLKYQFKYRSGVGAWQWKLVDDDATEASVQEDGTLDEIADQEGSGGDVRFDFFVVDKAPRWVVEAKIKDAGRRVLAAERDARRFINLLDTMTEDCKQCHGAGSYDDRRDVSCPTCGRDVARDTLAFWLMPDDTVAVKLLGSLVEQGRRSVKSKKMRWPVEDADEGAAFSRLVKLGLAGGSSQYDVHEIYATPSGVTEWAKHKPKPT